MISVKELAKVQAQLEEASTRLGEEKLRGDGLQQQMQGMQRHIGRLEHEINKYKYIVSKAKDKKHLAALMEENEEIKLQIAQLKEMFREMQSTVPASGAAAEAAPGGDATSRAAADADDRSGSAGSRGGAGPSVGSEEGATTAAPTAATGDGDGGSGDVTQASNGDASAELRRRVAALEAQLAQERESHGEDLRRMVERLAEKEEQMASVRATAAKQQRAAEAVSASAESASAESAQELTQAKLELDDMRDQVDLLRLARDRFRQQAEQQAEQLKQLRSELETAQAASTTPTEDQVRRSDEYRTLTKRLEAVQSELEGARREHATAEERQVAELGSLREKLRSATRRRAEAQSELQKLQLELDEIEDARDAALRARAVLEERAAAQGAARLKAAAEQERAQMMGEDLRQLLLRSEMQRAVLRSAREELERRCAALQEELAARAQEVASASEDAESAKQSLDDFNARLKISQRKSQQLVKDLRAQLARSKRSLDELKSENERLQGEVQRLQDGRAPFPGAAAGAAGTPVAGSPALSSHLTPGHAPSPFAVAVAVAATAADFGTPGGRPVSTPLRRASGSGLDGALGHAGTGSPLTGLASGGPAGAVAAASSRHGSLTRTMSVGGSPPVRRRQADPETAREKQIAFALAQRLEALMAENGRVKEQVAFLERNIQLLTHDLEEKKQLLAQFTGSSKNTDTAAVPEMLADAALRQSPETARALVRATLAENARLKGDLHLMGEELIALKQMLREQALAASAAAAAPPPPAAAATASGEKGGSVDGER